jgi:hypothetical protein
MTSTGIGQQSEDIVQAIIKELSDRRGVGHALEQIDEDVMAELVDSLQLIVRRILERARA